MSNEKQFIDFKKKVEKLKEIDGAEEYAKQLAHLFLGNGLSLQTILLMAIDFGQQHPHWIPVEERLPEKDGKYLFYDEVLGLEVSIYYDGVALVPSVTHWMEIQPPRKESEIWDVIYT